MPSEIVVFNSDTLIQSNKVTMSASELLRKTVIEYSQKRKAIPSWHKKKFFEISFMMYSSMILVINF